MTTLAASIARSVSALDRKYPAATRGREGL